MTIRLNIGPEKPVEEERFPQASRHVLNLKDLDDEKKPQANDALDLKGRLSDIQGQENKGRICIVGEKPVRGMGRLGVVAGALFMVFALNLFQLVFLVDSEKDESIALASEAFSSFEEGFSSLLVSGNEEEALGQFEAAQANLELIEENIGFLLDHESEYLGQPALVETLDHFLEAGTLMADVGQDLASFKQEAFKIPQEGSLTEFLNQLSLDYLEPAAIKMGNITNLLLDTELSGTGYEEQLSSFLNELEQVNELFQFWLESKDSILAALGDRHPQLYLVLFQNEGELFPAGGFIGSMALVQVNDGRIDSVEFYDSYQWDDRHLHPEEIPLDEFKETGGSWWFGDAGTSPNFPTTAENAMYLLDRAGGPGVDGVIAINTSAAQAFLEVTGPIQIESLPEPIGAENFLAVIGTLVEGKAFGAEDPKIVLEELMEAFLSTVDDPQLKLALLTTALDESLKKQISVYHRYPEVQDMLSQLGVTAEMPKLGELEGDFLLPLFMSVGNKTRHYIHTDIDHQTTVFEDGSMVVALTITQEHRFGEDSLAWLKEVTAAQGFTAWTSNLERIMGLDTHTSMMRLYAPEGIQIEEVQGDLYRDELQFRYDVEQDLSYYALEQSLEPGETKQFTIFYTLPWSLDGEDTFEYEFQLFKQPGLKNINFRKTIQTMGGDILSVDANMEGSFSEGVYQIDGPLKGDLWMRGLLN